MHFEPQGFVATKSRHTVAKPMFIMQSMINLKPQTSNLKLQTSNLFVLFLSKSYILMHHLVFLSVKSMDSHQ